MRIHDGLYCASVEYYYARTTHSLCMFYKVATIIVRNSYATIQYVTFFDSYRNFENVLDAFAELIRILTDELRGAKFETVLTVCLTCASKRLQSQIRKATNVNSLFELLACSYLSFNYSPFALKWQSLFL